MRITIVGAGHGGSALAAVLAGRGHEVSLLKIGSTCHNEHFQAMERRNSIELTGSEGAGVFRLREVSTCPEAVVPDADVIFLCYVTNYHPLVAARLAPFLRSNHTIVIAPGYGSSLIFKRYINDALLENLPLLAELETLPYSSRITAPGSVMIVSKNVCHPFAAYPGCRAEEIEPCLSELLGNCVSRTHVLEVALHNPNLIIHVIGVLMNVSRVESHSRDFSLYRDGFSPSIWNLVARLDSEKMDVLEKLKAPRVDYFHEFCMRTFGTVDMDADRGFEHYAQEAPAGPFCIDHRYITEDVPMGLGLLHSVGELVGLRTPVCDSLINIASALLPLRDFWGEARRIQHWIGGGVEDVLHELINGPAPCRFYNGDLPHRTDAAGDAMVAEEHI